MIVRFHSVLSQLLVPVVAFMLIVPFDLLAQSHVAAPQDLRNELRRASQDRSEHIAKVQRFLASPDAQKVLDSVHMDPTKAQQAVTLLSDQELARLSSQVDRTEFAGAGLSLTTQQVTIIIVGAILVIVIAIVASR